jgi:epoxyqueuosine reductase
MGYLAAEPEQRAAPANLWPVAQSLVAAALSYQAELPPPSSWTSAEDGGGGALGPDAGPRGRVARYALGADYHRVLHARLRALQAAIEEEAGHPVQARACVDTLPMLEREAVARAGVGFVGKHGVVIVPGAGSWLLLGVLLVDLALEPDPPEPNRCGRCHLCLDACPTSAFDDAYRLDPRRCISYLTIEHRGSISPELRPLMGDWVYGCDRCQEVCPFVAGKVAAPDAELRVRAERAHPPLLWLVQAGSKPWRRFSGGSALVRATATMMRRNAAVALGNCDDERAAAAVAAAVLGDAMPVVRGHAAWALGRLAARGVIGDAAAHRARVLLEQVAAHDEDASVRQEATAALAGG